MAAVKTVIAIILHQFWARYGAKKRPEKHGSWKALLSETVPPDRGGRLVQLQVSISRCQSALDATPESHPDRAHRLRRLGVVYHERYKENMALVDLDIAIEQFEKALDIIPKAPDVTQNKYRSDQAHQHDSLGAAYRDRYLRTGAIIDLELATQQYHEALDITPRDSPSRGTRLQNLGSLYYTRYERSGETTDLELAIQQCQEGLNMAPKGHLDRAHRLQSLGIIYYNKYKRIGTTADLELAVERFQEAVELTPNTPLHPTWIEKSFVRASRLDSLGAAYRERYIGTGAIADLDTAIQHFQEAVDITGSDHRHSYRLQALGAVHGDRYLKTGAAVDLATAIQLYEKALDEDFSPFLDRLRSARSLFPFYAKTNSWALAHQAASRATYLVPFLTSRCLSTFDKQHLLTEVAGLSCDAVAFALMAEEKPCEAIRLLELGRGVIVSSLGELRVDTYYLQQKDQRLAEKYNHARDQLDTSIYLTRQIDQRYAAAQDLEYTILEIRKLPGFDRFLLAPSEDELKVAAIPGPIVIINASEYRCDALVVENDGLRAIRLPDLHSSDIRDRAKTLVNPDLISDLLEWLWYTTVSPVLDALGFTEPSPSCWPRVWWVPTGLLTKFPLHAAGLYSKRSSDTALDRVISSYSSSIQALLQSRQKGPAVSVVQGSEKAVLVGMEKTPGHRDLRFVPQEMTTLKSLCDTMQLRVIEPLACRGDVLDALQNCKVFHFAGHGLTDALDPSNSSLLLSDGTLTVANLLETNLHSRTPFLAYLSACGTGRLKNEMLIDESLHLISAFQLAGFRHVIGTLWEVHDRSCVDVTTMVYEWMRGQNMSDESVSESLHHASRKLRSQWIAENDIRTSKHQTGIRKKDDQMATEQSHLSQEVVREPRDVVPCEDTPPYWVPFVHFGV